MATTIATGECADVRARPGCEGEECCVVNVRTCEHKVSDCM